MVLDFPASARKVVVHLKAVGGSGAPILKQAKLQISGNEKFAKVIDHLCRQLHRETLFVYVNSAFSPNPDELVIDLCNNFGFSGQLMVNYAYTPAWRFLTPDELLLIVHSYYCLTNTLRIVELNLNGWKC